MPLTSGALTTFANAQAFVGEQFAPEAKQLEVELIVNAVSAAMSRLSGRQFEYRSSIIDNLPSYGHSMIVLRTAPVDAISKVELIGFDGSVVTTYDAGSFRADALAGVLHTSSVWPSTAPLVYGADVSYANGAEARLLRVTYSGGWRTPEQARLALFAGKTELPSEIELACLQSVAAVLQRRGNDLNISSKSQSGGSSVSYRANKIVGLPVELILPETAAVCLAYKRPEV